jgi:hypothetical protein
MANFLDMQNRVSLDYLNRNDLGAEVKRALIRAVKHYEKTRLWFNQTATSIAIGTASMSVAVPSDFLALNFVTVRDSSADSIVNIKGFDRIAYQQRSAAGGGAAASGVAQEVCYWNDTLQFFPLPSSATSLTVHYTQSLPTLSADTDTNGWTSAGEDIIVYHATADMWANVLRIADPATVANFKQMEMEALSALMSGNDMRMGNAQQQVVGSNQSANPGLPPKKTQ